MSGTEHIGDLAPRIYVVLYDGVHLRLVDLTAPVTIAEKAVKLALGYVVTLAGTALQSRAINNCDLSARVGD